MHAPLRVSLLLIALVGCTAAGCTRESPNGPREATPEAPFHRQVEQVAAGEARAIEVHGQVVTDADLEALSRLDQLERLVLDRADISDVGLERIARLDGLTDLRLPRTSVTDDGMRHFERMTRLERLRFGSSQVTDAGVAHLASLIELRSLILVETPITDAALPVLAELPKLESVYFQSTGVSETGAAEWLPTLHVHVQSSAP